MAKLRVDKIAAPIVKDEFTGSVYFDGSGDYLSIPSNVDLNPESGDFTLEMWVYPSSYNPSDVEGGYNALYVNAATNGLWIGTYQGSFVVRKYGDTNVLTYSSTPTVNKWTHVAVTREGSSLRLFYDGVLQASETDSTAFVTAATTIGFDGSSVHWHGYISNLRFCKGHAVYDGNFTVPTRELEVHTGAKGVVFPAADNRTVLLACQSSTDATAEATGRHTITAAGNAHAQSANPGLLRRTLNLTTVTENTGAVYFDGSGDRLIIPTSTDLNLTGDFTIEYWVYINSVDSISYISFFSTSSNGTFTSETAIFWGASEDYFAFQNKGTTLVTATMADPTNAWYHIAVTRSGSTTRMFLNGKQTGSTTTSWDAVTGQSWYIGDRPSGAVSGNYPLNGYISNFRICKGHAVYTSDFAPPTRELEVHPETVLLACYDGENIFADKTGRHNIAAIGDRLSSPTPTATDSPIGITTFQPGLTRNVDPTAGPTFQGGAGFVSQNWLTLPKGTTTDRNRTGGRGLIAGGTSGGGWGTKTNSITYIQISSSGNAQNFGDLSTLRSRPHSVSSSTRAIFGGGSEGASAANAVNTIEYVTIASEGNAVDFGTTLTDLRRPTGGVANNTRGLFAGGYIAPANKSEIDHLIFATLGNVTDFGDLSVSGSPNQGSSNSTRGVYMGGGWGAQIDYVTIASTGSGADFGDIQNNRSSGAGASSSTRALLGGGSTTDNAITYITISTLGNDQDFGDLTVGRRVLSGTSNGIRGIFAGGYTPDRNTIDYITISSTGDAKDFGDLIRAEREPNACSDSHGGIS